MNVDPWDYNLVHYIRFEGNKVQACDGGGQILNFELVSSFKIMNIDCRDENTAMVKINMSNIEYRDPYHEDKILFQNQGPLEVNLLFLVGSYIGLESVPTAWNSLSKFNVKIIADTDPMRDPERRATNLYNALEGPNYPEWLIFYAAMGEFDEPAYNEERSSNDPFLLYDRNQGYTKWLKEKANSEEIGRVREIGVKYDWCAGCSRHISTDECIQKTLQKVDSGSYDFLDDAGKEQVKQRELDRRGEIHENGWVICDKCFEDNYFIGI